MRMCERGEGFRHVQGVEHAHEGGRHPGLRVWGVAEALYIPALSSAPRSALTSFMNSTCSPITSQYVIDCAERDTVAACPLNPRSQLAV